MGLVKKIFFLFFMLLLWLPLIQKQTAFFTETPLSGAFITPEQPSIHVDSVKTLQYQKQVEAYLNSTFGFRPLLIRIKNSLGYIFWKEIPVEDNIEGKDGFIFSKGSIDRTIGVYYNGNKKNEQTIERINFLKEGLEKRGAHLLVVMAPSKECVLTNKLPYVYHNQFKPESDYVDLLKGYAKYQIPYLDFCNYFRKINDTSRFPIFTKTGFHWSSYGSSIAHDSLLHYIGKLFKQPIASYQRDGIVFSSEAKSSENDFEEPMNFLFKLDKNASYAYPKFKWNKTGSSTFKPKVIIIGDSFFWQLKNQKLMMNIFSENSKFWYYFAKTSFPIGDVPGVPMSDINILQELETADLVILVGSMGTLNNFPFGVTDYYYENTSTPEMLSTIVDYIDQHRTLFANQLNAGGNVNGSNEEKNLMLAKRMCRDRQYFNIKAKNGKFVCADAGKNQSVFADKTVASTWERFSVFNLDGSNVAIASFQNLFLSSELNNRAELTATRTKIGTWEIFAKVDLGNSTFALKAYNGKFLSIDPNSLEVIANANSIGPNETFCFIPN